VILISNNYNAKYGLTHFVARQQISVGELFSVSVWQAVTFVECVRKTDCSVTCNLWAPPLRGRRCLSDISSFSSCFLVEMWPDPELRGHWQQPNEPHKPLFLFSPSLSLSSRVGGRYRPLERRFFARYSSVLCQLQQFSGAASCQLEDVM